MTEELRKKFSQMTIEELRAEYPELVAQIEQEAVTADRARIQEIEEIQDTIGDTEMIAAAKFTAPTNAAALALAAMKKQKALGADFLTARKAETAKAAAVPAAAAAADDPEAIAKAQKEEEAQQITKVAEMYGKIFK